jgi:hypothetical protein
METNEIPRGTNQFLFNKSVREHTKSGEVVCPSCLKKGGVRARKDAYADHALVIRPETQTLDWVYASTAIMDETQAYECFECNAELEYEEILKYNGAKS